MMLFDQQDRKDLLETLWFWVRDFKNKGGRGDFDQTHELYLRFKHQLENGFTTDTPEIDPVLKDLMEKCDLFMSMDISFQHGDDYRQRLDFGNWLTSATGRNLSMMYNPYDDETDELYWQAYEFALLKKFY